MSWRAGEEMLPAKHRVILAQATEPRREVDQLALLSGGAPVEPAELIVLAVAVVVAVLGARELISAQQQRDAFGQHQRGQEIAALTGAQLQDILVVCGSFDTAVPASVVVVAVAVVLAVGLVVLGVVADEVVEREAIVDGDDVHRRRRASATVAEQIPRATDARGHVRQNPARRAPEVADGVAESSIPFAPAGRELTEVVSHRCPMVRRSA